jgi:hypothetical protein
VKEGEDKIQRYINRKIGKEERGREREKNNRYILNKTISINIFIMRVWIRVKWDINT